MIINIMIQYCYNIKYQNISQFDAMHNYYISNICGGEESDSRAKIGVPTFSSRGI